MMEGAMWAEELHSRLRELQIQRPWVWGWGLGRWECFFQEQQAPCVAGAEGEWGTGLAGRQIYRAN